jgi:hypothetical protein
MALLVGAAIVFSLYKALSAFYIHKSANPSLPTGAFVAPPQNAITKDSYVVSPRLPTDVEVALLGQSRQVSAASRAGSVSVKKLLSLGMTSSEAQAARAQVQTSLSQLRGLKAQAGASYVLGTASATAALVKVDYVYYDPQGLASSKSLEMVLTWNPKGPQWSSARLSSLTMAVSS